MDFFLSLRFGKKKSKIDDVLRGKKIKAKLFWISKFHCFFLHTKSVFNWKLIAVSTFKWLSDRARNLFSSFYKNGNNGDNTTTTTKYILKILKKKRFLFKFTTKKKKNKK